MRGRSEELRGVDREKSTAIAGASASNPIARTDTERIDALAEAINHIVLYETGHRGAKFRIEYRSNIQKGKKKHGVRPDFLRMLADGLLKASAGPV